MQSMMGKRVWTQRTVDGKKKPAELGSYRRLAAAKPGPVPSASDQSEFGFKSAEKKLWMVEVEKYSAGELVGGKTTNLPGDQR